jgi:hypothetical protein
MNTKLLRRVQRQILKEPKQFQMLSLFTESIDKVHIPNCGTAASIAGWVGCLFKNRKPSKAPRNFDAIEARIILGLDLRGANKLFFFCNWPEKFRKHALKKEGTVEFAKQAARRIEHFIKTNGTDEVQQKPKPKATK